MKKFSRQSSSRVHYTVNIRGYEKLFSLFFIEIWCPSFIFYISQDIYDFEVLILNIAVYTEKVGSTFKLLQWCI